MRPQLENVIREVPRPGPPAVPAPSHRRARATAKRSPRQSRTRTGTNSAGCASRNAERSLLREKPVTAGLPAITKKRRIRQLARKRLPTAVPEVTAKATAITVTTAIPQQPPRVPPRTAEVPPIPSKAATAQAAAAAMAGTAAAPKETVAGTVRPAGQATRSKITAPRK